MKYRKLGKTGFEISEVSFGAWAIGGSWGKVSEKDAVAALNKAVDLGVNFFDTADVYGDGRSEKLIAQILKSRKEEIFVATKAGRRLNPHTVEGYTTENIEGFIDRSLKNLKVDALDLVQLHCPPTQVYYKPELFEGLDGLVKKGKIKHYGVSVEKVEEAVKAIEFPGVATVQIIFNMFRQRPKELFFELAKKNNIGIIARVPLASGLLAGKLGLDTKFASTDHRKFNRHGEMFDKGETFAGVNYNTGLNAVEEIRNKKPQEFTMAQLALKWILMHEEISCTIPGGKNKAQVEENVEATELPKIDEKLMDELEGVYDRFIKEQVHQRW